MKLTTSYPARLKTTPWQSHLLEDTVKLCQKALEDIIRTLEPHWDELAKIPMPARKTAAEHHYHATKDNPNPENADWDAYNPYMPSDIRRYLNAKALGILSSWSSNTKNWEKGGQQGHAPQLQYKHDLHKDLTLYNSNAFGWAEKSEIYTGIVRIKVWTGKTWAYEYISVQKSDLRYLETHKQDLKPSSPTLERHGKTWSIRFAYEEKVELADASDPQGLRILSVDQGVNTAATCVVMESDGTVLARKSIRFAKEQDRLRHLINTRKKQQQAGARHTPKIWGKINTLNKHIADETVRFIVELAQEWGCHVIVMENLTDIGQSCLRGKAKREQCRLWRCRYVSRRVEARAHGLGMRVSRVCAWNTSRLAFDGSGRVRRGEEIAAREGCPDFRYGWVEFSTGKLYNADLNAAYNIGARYFVRVWDEHLLKSTAVTEWSRMRANVSCVVRRSTCALADLIDLRKALDGESWFMSRRVAVGV